MYFKKRDEKILTIHINSKIQISSIVLLSHPTHVDLFHFSLSFDSKEDESDLVGNESTLNLVSIHSMKRRTDKANC